jgi:hypothetical protein
VTASDLPPEASEADVLDQQVGIQPDPDEPPLGGEPNWEADPADVAEQAWTVEDDDDYPDGER